LSIIAIAKNITEEPPAKEYTEPPFVGDMTAAPALTTMTDPADPFTEPTAPAEVLSTTTAQTAAETTETAETTTAEATTATTTAATTAAVTAAAADYNKEYFSNWLFIGDSIFTGLYGYNFLDSTNVFAKIGFSPSSVRTSDVNGTTVYQKLAVAKPEVICIMLGTNGLAYLSTDTMIADYGKFIGEIRDLLPDSRIIVLSITPVTKKHSDEKPETLEIITAYNEALKTLAEDSEVDYFDIFTELSDENGYSKTEYAENDGLHLKGAAYTKVLSMLEEYVEDGDNGNE
jgi:lysophospholipase L1-like esterase